MVEPTKISYREWYRLRSRRPTALARGAVDLGEFSALSADAILSIQPRVLRGKLRHITQVTNWSGLSLSPLLRGAIVAIIYFVFAKVSLTLASLHPSASPVWPPSGLALASLLLWGNGLWPAIATGAFLANVTTLGSLSTSSLIAGGNTLEALLTVALLERLKASTHLFEGSSQVVLFACLTLLPGTMISATMGVGSLVLGGFADPAKFPSIWLTWWLGDVGGQLLVTPLIVLWAKSSLQEMGRAELQRLAFLLGATIIVGLVAFSPLPQQITAHSALGFVAIGPLLWAALRHNQRDTATVAFMLSAFAIWGTLSDGGPFARPNLNDSFLLTMAFVISTAVPSLVLSADVVTRRLSEERHRALVEHANDIVATLDLHLRVTSVNPAIERILGFAPAEVVGRSLRHHVPQEQPHTHAEMNRKFQGAASTQYEFEVLTKAGVRRILEVSSKLIADATGKPVAIHAIARDITERKEAKRAEAHLAELDHRVKNLLATMIAVSQRTREGHTSMDEFVSAFDGRIRSMAEAHTLLSTGRWRGVNLAQLVRQELAPCAAALNTMVEGPDIVLAADAAQPVAFVLHELATNAAKYGALSSPKGHVSVQWHQRANEHIPGALVLEWKETGGPLVPASISPGHGTSVVKDLIPYELGGGVDLVFAAEGVRCRLEIPLKWLNKANALDGR
jgi:PAS domain S-box-containing protein